MDDMTFEGYVMLQTRPVVFAGKHPALREEDLYFSQDPERFWINGSPAAHTPHVTLKGGVHDHSLSVDAVRQMLDGWTAPDTLIVDEFEVFPSRHEDEPYGCVVAKIMDVSGLLADAHARLSRLPHIDTFDRYRPHMTIAYVKAEAADEWCATLNMLTQGRVTGFTSTGVLDLGPKGTFSL